MVDSAAIDTNNSPAGDGVFRRQVFYIPGYDPFPPRRYRELYRTESADQAAISGYAIGLLASGGGVGWKVASDIDGKKTLTQIDVLVWSDIVQGSMDQGILATYAQLARTAWTYIGSGALFRLMRLRKGPMIAALYPVVMLLVQLGLALLVGIGLGLGAARLWPGSLGNVCGGLVGIIAVVMVLRGFKSLDARLYAHYLMHDYAFSAQAGGAYPAKLEVRMAEFTQRIRAAIVPALDEVLIVGHSSGAHLAVSILADLLRHGVPERRPALGFVSLGQVVPMVSFLPKATRLRADLAFMAAQPHVAWVDVTAPGDGCAFALCDPVAVTGVAPLGKRWPLVVSAAFSQTLSMDRWQALRWRFFRLHFQYLCAFDVPGDYDYFQITAGPLTLAERYRDRAASKSRIETPRSAYRNVA
jgi:hypothetical protein